MSKIESYIIDIENLLDELLCRTREQGNAERRYLYWDGDQKTVNEAEKKAKDAYIKLIDRIRAEHNGA